MLWVGSGAADAVMCQSQNQQSSTNAVSKSLWSSLDKPPSVDEARLIAESNTGFAEFDLSQDISPDAIHILKNAGVKVFAYNVGNGGGPIWNEPENLLMGEDAFDIVREATNLALIAGADGLHLDNMHAMDEQRLEALMDAQVTAARSIGRLPALHLKNAAQTYLDILKRRPDLRAATKVAVVEHLVSDPEAPRELAKMGIQVFGIEFAQSRFGSPTTTVPQVSEFLRENTWVAGVWAMPNEDHYEGRTATYVTHLCRDIVD
jgi:hypothetical protein